jgi:Flp pilus assembly pilin Flp
MRNRKGQSILEYLVIATVIVLALTAIRGTLVTNMNTMFQNAADQTDNANASLAGVTPEGP